MSTPAESIPEALPLHWVEKIWMAMRAEWGAAFDRQWECPAGEDPARHVRGLKEHWARRLAGLFNRPDAIRYALENLPAHPINLPDFRALCCRAPEPFVPMLPAPKADPERVAAAIAKVMRGGVRHPMACALALRDRDMSGEHLTQFQRKYWREVLPDPACATAGQSDGEE